jgi:hypothetical protein
VLRGESIILDEEVATTSSHVGSSHADEELSSDSSSLSVSSMIIWGVLGALASVGAIFAIVYFRTTSADSAKSSLLGVLSS